MIAEPGRGVNREGLNDARLASLRPRAYTRGGMPERVFLAGKTFTALDGERLAFARSHLGFYDKLSDAERAKLERSIEVARFPKGAALKTSDSECLGVLLLREGELRTYIRSEDGREVTLYRLGPGELCILSASCVLNSLTFDVSIDAVRDSEALKIGMPAFEEIIKDNVWVENFAYKNAAERFSDIMWAVEQLVFMRFDKRLAIFLLDESAGDPGGEISATHEEIAKFVGSAREVVSRMLKSFESQGLVALGRGSVKVIGREGLKRLL
jgi:CRP/FNR family transcriptional regulator, anaerobic regulatory protein